MTSQQPAAKRPWYKKWWVWAIVGGVVVIGAIGNALGLGSRPTVVATPNHSAVTVSTPTPTPTPTSETTEPAPVDAEALWLEMHGVSDPIEFATREGYSNDLSNPLYAVQRGWGGSTTSFLRISVQEPLSKDAVMNLGRNVLNFIGPKFPKVSGIVFTDSSGLDHNFYRRDAPLADQGQ